MIWPMYEVINVDRFFLLVWFHIFDRWESFIAQHCDCFFFNKKCFQTIFFACVCNVRVWEFEHSEDANEPTTSRTSWQRISWPIRVLHVYSQLSIYIQHIKFWICLSQSGSTYIYIVPSKCTIIIIWLDTRIRERVEYSERFFFLQRNKIFMSTVDRVVRHDDLARHTHSWPTSYECKKCGQINFRNRPNSTLENFHECPKVMLKLCVFRFLGSYW